mmetsp:Transcript_69210/g.225431  ORF Transcript_69210/g.225431 Transcript_69210/m.225431 type:complete len:131 (-) Transcript_69210:1203-1595(-)
MCRTPPRHGHLHQADWHPMVRAGPELLPWHCMGSAQMREGSGALHKSVPEESAALEACRLWVDDLLLALQSLSVPLQSKLRSCLLHCSQPCPTPPLPCLQHRLIQRHACQRSIGNSSALALPAPTPTTVL